MSLQLRILLIVASFLLFFYVVRKIRNSKMQIEHTVFWVVFCLFLVLMSLAPQIVDMFVKILGVESPVNLVFIFIIFWLIVKQFLMTVEISKLEMQTKELVEEIALRDKEDKGNQ